MSIKGSRERTEPTCEVSVQAPCAGLVVEVPVWVGCPRPDAEWIVARIQSSETRAIVTVAAPDSAAVRSTCGESERQAVAAVFVEVGDYVRPGTVLMVLGDADRVTRRWHARIASVRALLRV